ncbi:hypothetical protein GCM10009825_38760 [Arthrobacter humicola]|uniref:Uncharacterized protein n=1 Tax=Arthrobacter humicola TaxID=409291 RepID=A0ABP5LIF5_9MICC
MKRDDCEGHRTGHARDRSGNAPPPSQDAYRWGCRHLNDEEAPASTAVEIDGVSDREGSDLEPVFVARGFAGKGCDEPGDAQEHPEGAQDRWVGLTSSWRTS